jgi:hypothetical protein
MLLYIFKFFYYNYQSFLLLNQLSLKYKFRLLSSKILGTHGIILHIQLILHPFYYFYLKLFLINLTLIFLQNVLNDLLEVLYFRRQSYMEENIKVFHLKIILDLRKDHWLDQRNLLCNKNWCKYREYCVLVITLKMPAYDLVNIYITSLLLDMLYISHQVPMLRILLLNLLEQDIN